jgi:hypothetical protein
MRSLPELILDLMKSEYPRFAPDIPLSDSNEFVESEAIEVAINDLIDYACDAGYSVTHRNNPIDCYGLKVEI